MFADHELILRLGEVVHYDRGRQRVWVLGQRCHHGAVGAILAGAACVAAAVTPERGFSVIAAVIAASLMAHDRHDVRVWFERGWQTST